MLICQPSRQVGGAEFLPGALRLREIGFERGKRIVVHRLQIEL